MKRRVNSIYQIAMKSLELCKNYSSKMTLQAQCKQLNIIESLQKTKIQNFGVGKISQRAGVGIRNILIQGPLRITLYHLPQGQIMKLHDHPDMQVVNYIVKGKMEGRIYSHLSKNIYRKKILYLKQGDFKFIDGKITEQENLHQFLAVQPTFFLDIIFPDYDDSRVCRFYEEVQLKDDLAYLKEVPTEQIDFFEF